MPSVQTEMLDSITMLCYRLWWISQLDVSCQGMPSYRRNPLLFKVFSVLRDCAALNQ